MNDASTARKSAVRSRSGLVAAQNRKAAEEGARVLARGGNAMDAAIVTALVLSIVEPWLSGIGGGGFLLHCDGATGETTTLDFNVKSALALDPRDYPLAREQAGNWFNWPSVAGDRNVTGYASICTPGAIAGFAEALERFGLWSWSDALQPAIAHAERGLEIDWIAAMSIGAEAPSLARDAATAAILLDDGAGPRAGVSGAPRMKPMRDKAKLLRRLAKAGPRDFYEGEIAAQLARDLEAGGSALRLRDFASYQATWRAPLTSNYGPYLVNGIDGLSGGPSFVDASERLKTYRLRPGADPADAALAYATSIREAYEARLTRMGHAATPDAGCTSHVSVVDSQGTMVSLTNTLLSRFGSKATPPSGGFLMNNGMMWFDPRPQQPNSIAPGVKPLANMCPLILSRDGRPALSIGAAGGRTIFPTVLQLISYLEDFGLSLEEAFHTPRIDASEPVIKIDIRAASSVAAKVATRYPIELVEDTIYPVRFSNPSAVMRDPATGEFIGMAHPTSPWAAVVSEDMVRA